MTFIKGFSRFLIAQGKQNNIINLSAQMSYRALLAFIPFLMLLYNFLNWASIEVNKKLIAELSKFLPASILKLLHSAIENSINTPISTGTNLLFGFFIFYVSVSAMYSLIISLNRIFGQEETRGIPGLLVQSILYLFLFLIILLFTIIFYIFGKNILYLLFNILNLSQTFAFFLAAFSVLYVSVVTALIITLIYMFAPKKHLNFFQALPGGLFVSIGWLSILFIYNIFAKPFLDLTTFFNNIQGPFSLCILIFMICFTLTLGGIINLYALDKKTSPRKAGIK
ncbi:MAG: YihY/virulence factor BrkB family protein [Acetobacterium sp.]